METGIGLPEGFVYRRAYGARSWHVIKESASHTTGKAVCRFIPKDNKQFSLGYWRDQRLTAPEHVCAACTIYLEVQNRSGN